MRVLALTRMRSFRLVILALYFATLVVFCSSRRERDKASCWEEKTQKPDPRDLRGEDWQPCCSDGFRFEPSQYNYVWPMETIEKMYFFIAGISMLLQSSEKQFKMVEPQVCENTISPNGIPISQLMIFEEVDTSKIISKDDWQMAMKPQIDISVNTIFFLDIFAVKEGQSTYCRTEKGSLDQFCYHLSTTRKENRIAIQFKPDADLGLFTWSKIFTIIRSSPWARENKITDTVPITLALYEHWHHQLFRAKMLVVDSKKYGKIHPSDYIMNAAKQLLTVNGLEKVMNGYVDNAIAWRMQKQFNDPNGKGKVSELTEQIDKGGVYLVM